MILITWLINFFKKLKRRYIIAKAYVKLQAAFRIQLRKRKTLREAVNAFLYEFFGVNANSKYIPKDFKNNEEVKVAVTDRFGKEMTDLNLKFSDLFS